MRNLGILVATVFLGAMLLPAQRMSVSGGSAHAGGGHMSVAHGANGHGGNGFHSRGFGHNRRGFNYPYGYGALYPWYIGYDGYWDSPWDLDDRGMEDQPPPEASYQQQASATPVIVMQSPQQAPPRPAPSPKFVEIPKLASDGPAKEQPPAMFILTNGQRIESDRYILSAKSVSVDVGREQRNIPLSDVNIDATLAANHQRGLDLTIPRDANSIYLGF